MRKISVFLMAGFALLLQQGAFADETKVFDLMLLHTNDHHGHYNSFNHGVGGMAARHTLLNDLRKKAEQRNQEVILLSGGDINTGTFESDLQKAEPDFKAMNLLGYDAMAVGNHEWDHPLEVIRKQESWASFPFLSANTRFKSNQKRVFDSYKVFCYPKKAKDCPVKVGVFGITTPETSNLVMPEDVEEIAFTDVTKEAKQVVRELKGKGVDVIIAVTHMGHNGPKRDRFGKFAYHDVNLAKRVKGIDVIVGGHTQIALEKPLVVGKTLILQAQEWGKYVGRLDIRWKKRGSRYKRVKGFSYKLMPVNPFEKKVVDGNKTYQLPAHIKEIKEDAKMLAFFEPYNKKAKALGDQVAGKVLEDVKGDRAFVRSHQAPIGMWIGSVLQQRTQSDVAMFNGGGIRSSIEKGDITRKDIHNVHPFGNMIVYADLTPQELVDFVHRGYKSMQEAALELQKNEPSLSGSYPQFYGLRLHVNDQGEMIKVTSSLKKRVWSIDVYKGKVTRSTKSQYRLSTTGFTATGGDDYPPIDQLQGYLDTGITIDRALIGYLEREKTLDIGHFAKYLTGNPILTTISKR